MKIRQGFVSNSSSSSFIVGFKEVPQTVEEMQRALFGDRQEFQSSYDYDAYWPTRQIAEIVLADVEEPVLADEIIQDMTNGYIDGITPEPDYSRNTANETMQESMDRWQKWDDARKEAMAEYWQGMQHVFRGCQIYMFEYSDKDGDLGSAMEHGDLFRRLPHIQVSKH